MGALVAIFLIELAALAWYDWLGVYALRKFVIVNMTLILLFAPKLTLFFGHESNVANLFYAAVVVAQVAIAEWGGAGLARESTRLALASVVLVASLVGALAAVPAVGDQHVTDAIRTLAPQSLVTLGASLCAFAATNAALIAVVGRARGLPILARFALAVAAAQAVDSAVFFPVAFSQHGAGAVLEMAVTGFAVKTAVGVALLPAVLWRSAVAWVTGRPRLPHADLTNLG